GGRDGLQNPVRYAMRTTKALLGALLVLGCQQPSLPHPGGFDPVVNAIEVPTVTTSTPETTLPLPTFSTPTCTGPAGAYCVRLAFPAEACGCEYQDRQELTAPDGTTVVDCCAKMPN